MAASGRPYPRPACMRAGPFQILLADRSELAAAFPHSGHGLPELFVGDVQVPLRLLDVGVAEHQLNRANVDTVRQQAAGAFVPLMPRAA
jgi:hypothetical protein